MVTKKHLWIWLILSLVTIMVTGCGLTVGGGQPTAEALQPLTAADWPTPPPATPLPSPTPFPEITLVPTATPTVNPTATATPAAVATGVSGLGGSAASLLAQASSASGGLAAVAAGFVTVDTAAIRRGPGASYTVVDQVKQGDLVAILGQNPAGDWLYVLAISQAQGWLPANSLRVTGSLANAPVLPSNPLTGSTPSASTASSRSTAGLASLSSPALNKLEPVTTAQVNTAGLNVRQGPGVDYKILETLSNNDQVSVLAVNRPKDWALIEMTGGQRGWVALAYLAVEGAVADAPVVPAGILLGQGFTSIQSPASSPAVIKTASTTNNSSSTSPASQSTSPVSDLTPVAIARINTNEVDVRPGPGDAYAAIDKITDDQEKLSVLALDKSKSWVLVKPAFSHLGWVPVKDLAVQGSLAAAPQVITAWVDSNAVEVRRGPGIYNDVIGTLAINSLIAVLGLDETKSWALVKPIMGQGSGWTPIQFLTLDAPLAEIPPAPTPALPEQNPVQNQQAVSPPVQARPLNQSNLVFQLASGGDIMVIKPDGSGLRRLTNGIDPALSPDGKTVAFTRWQGESGSLWLINVDGSNEHQVLGFIKQAKGPAWSPDGSHIVLNYQHEGRLESTTDCYPLTKHGSPPQPPQNAYNIEVDLKDHIPNLCWTLPPDPHWGLMVVNVADGSFQDLYGGQYAFRPTWDPSQPWRIVDAAGNGLLETDVNRDFHQNITDKIDDGSPVFSPDGHYLAVTYGQPGGNQGYDIFRLNSDGSGRVRLTQTPLWVAVVPGDFKQWNNVSPTWSPDSAQIAFLSDRTGRWEIWVMNADGSNQHPMFSDEINNQLTFSYNFVDEQVLSWR
jgi:uncharacterized protein YgiM (DUF1202 family)